MVMETGKSTIYRQTSGVETRKGPMLQFEAEGSLLQNSLLLRGGQPLCSSGLHLIGRGPPPLGGQSALLTVPQCKC